MEAATKDKEDKVQGQARNRAELINKVKEQVELLEVLGRSFDSGIRVVGYSMATAIRVLVHDTPNSPALLAQLGELNSMEFIDTSEPLNPPPEFTTGGGLTLILVIARDTPNGGTPKVDWIPRCNLDLALLGAEPRDVSFQTWWNSDVLRDKKEGIWSRKSMVLAIANKEGGTHIDPHQPPNVRAIEVENSMGRMYEGPNRQLKPFPHGPLMASIRQIAYELERSITRRLASELST